MMKMTMTVTYEDGRTADVVVAPVTQVAFEREHGCGIGVLGTDQKLSHAYWLAWHASRTTVTFDDWLGTVESIDMEVDEPTPTQPAVPAT